MSLDDIELAITAYLYGDILVDKSLIPGKPIVSLVLDLVADMMKIELTRESSYWFLPTVFAVFIPVSETIDEGHQHWYLAIFLDEVVEDRPFYDFETTPNLNSSQFELEEPEGLPTLEHGSNDAGVWVASWMIACFEDDHFNIKVDDVSRMKIAVSLVSKNHNMIAYRVKRKASENLRKLYNNHHLD
ncbi:Ulp1 protease family, carboxy-terminal domain protein [Arachis hypogaea]|nr:Ulp1 protease family, carboxy-terminal domain protein [Arachis hypogaea]